MRAPSHRYIGLDGMRGVAALAVVCLHADGMGGLPHAPGAYLAVDLFFLLSGYVIADAYDQRLASGLGAWGFMRIRLIRLYPLYALALGLSALKLFPQLAFGTDGPNLASSVADYGFGAIMAPSPTSAGNAFGPLYPPNPAAWSLLFELLLNFSYAAAFRWLTARRRLALLVFVSGATLVWVGIAHQGVNVGGRWSDVLAGAPRAAFPFFLGVFLRRHGPSAPRLGGSYLVVVSVLLGAVLLAAPPDRTLTDAGCVLILFPALVMVAAATQPNTVLRAMASWAGDTSYAVYILHMPLLTLVLAAARHFAPSTRAALWAGPAFLAGLLVVAWVSHHAYDRPIRRWLTDNTRSGALPVLS